ncbi:MAG: VWA domain-containing protein [Spirochaetales bacterium]|nr:VWA domain-containing protein [Spirochaetales bacterium]
MDYRILIPVLILLLLPFIIFGQDLVLQADNLIIEQTLDGGYDLWIKATPGLGSIMITESTADPLKQSSSFSLRNPEYHKVNGDEKRLLNGEFLEAQGKTQFALIDSTIENHPEYGQVFHIFIPYIVEYGYSWSRIGELQILDGSWINIRTFEKSYSDYTGGFHDNPYIIRVLQKPLPGPPEGNYMDDAVSAFEEISDGEMVFGAGQEDIIDNIRWILQQTDGETLDLVLCLDTTRSMEDDIPYLKDSLIPMLLEETSGFSNFRFGMVLYKDYFEEYVTKTIPFQNNLDYIQSFLNNIRVFGGRDIPEAVNEALYEGIHKFDWSADSREIILIGDAPPHPRPRGKVTSEMVSADAESINISINSIILPQ